MIAKIQSAIPYGFRGELIEVEGDMNRGLPAFNIVGMANKTVSESRERVRSAIVNSGFSFPDRKVTINLAPAELSKDGAYLDLPIALAVLVLSKQLLKTDVARKMFVGELSLNGEIRPVRGIINIVEEAKRRKVEEIYVPQGNLGQARLVSGVEVVGVGTLEELFLRLKGQIQDGEGSLGGGRAGEPQVTSISEKARKTASQRDSGAILDHIRGQELAKRALVVAIAGHHNILLSGPPGAGKTLLAKAAAGLLPDLTPEETVEITKIYSLAGLATDEVVARRPFRGPHHSASATAMIGGGTGATPGEISLAHKGVLFLDEIPEFQRSVIGALRQPLEDREISISRANRKTTYPADFMLIATMNPCPCGYLGDPTHECKCTEQQILAYQKKLSGPLIDRFDMWIEVERVENRELREGVVKNTETGVHTAARTAISAAIARQAKRTGREGAYNSSLSSFEVSEKVQLDNAAEALLTRASEKLSLSARSYFKVLKVAQTIADLAGVETVTAEHLAEALNYRKR